MKIVRPRLSFQAAAAVQKSLERFREGVRRELRVDIFNGGNRAPRAHRFPKGDANPKRVQRAARD